MESNASEVSLLKVPPNLPFKSRNITGMCVSIPGTGVLKHNEQVASQIKQTVSAAWTWCHSLNHSQPTVTLLLGLL